MVGFFFLAYIYCVLQLTLLSRKPGNYGGIDWRFLARWNENDSQKAFLLTNIIMFIPFGVLFLMFGKFVRHILFALPVAVACSIGIESLQLRYRLGPCQLDDVVANSVGFLIGFLLFLLLQDVCFVLKNLPKVFSSLRKTKNRQRKIENDIDITTHTR